MLSRVSSWLLTERREDKIDDFAQEVESNGFWLLDGRESIAQTLLKNVDFKNEFHCETTCKSVDELAEHRGQCVFRSLNCTTEGCSARFCAIHKEKHDGTCPFKILPCEQKCSEMIVRHETDPHFITILPHESFKLSFLLCWLSIYFSTLYIRATLFRVSPSACHAHSPCIT